MTAPVHLLTRHLLSFQVRSHLGFRPHVYTWLGYSPLSHIVTPSKDDRPDPRSRCQRDTLPRSLPWGYFFYSVWSLQKPTATCARCLAHNAHIYTRHRHCQAQRPQGHAQFPYSPTQPAFRRKGLAPILLTRRRLVDMPCNCVIRLSNSASIERRVAVECRVFYWQPVFYAGTEY